MEDVMSTPLYADVSSFQDAIDWPVYAAWAKQFDGTSRIAMKSTEGVGYTDPLFQVNRAGALSAGIDVIIFYHYARPDLGNAPKDEANWQWQVVGAIRPQDVLMLDFEEQVPQATADWAYQWLVQQQSNYGGKYPTIYASDSYIRSRLQDRRLASYPLTLANWQFDPSERPACPPPWARYVYLQYTDRATIPGIPGNVDANIYLGGDMPNPGADPAFLQSYWNSSSALLGGVPDFTTGIAAAWKHDVAQDLWRGAPMMHEGVITWKGKQVPWQRFEGGFYTWENNVPYWHSNS
jgi:lysozyme